jgi:hypothetical protein
VSDHSCAVAVAVTTPNPPVTSERGEQHRLVNRVRSADLACLLIRAVRWRIPVTVSPRR